MTENLDISHHFAWLWCKVMLYECGKWWWWWWQNENEPVESLVILSPANKWWAQNVEINLNTSGSDGCRTRSRSSKSPTDERYNAETHLNADYLKSTDGSPLIKAWMGTNSCSLPEMQIGTNNTEKTPDDSDDSEWHRGSTDRHRMQQREIS